MGPAESLNKVTLRIPGLAMEGKKWPRANKLCVPKTQQPFPLPLGNVFNDYCFHQQNGLRGSAFTLKLQLKQR